MAALCKLDELRIKTDLELLHAINRELELGIREGRRALDAATWEVGQPPFLRAQRAYVTASRWFLLLREFASGRTEQTEARVRHLREMLDGLSAIASMPRPLENVSLQDELQAACC